MSNCCDGGVQRKATASSTSTKTRFSGAFAPGNRCPRSRPTSRSRSNWPAVVSTSSGTTRGESRQASCFRAACPSATSWCLFLIASMGSCGGAAENMATRITSESRPASTIDCAILVTDAPGGIRMVAHAPSATASTSTIRCSRTARATRRVRLSRSARRITWPFIAVSPSTTSAAIGGLCGGSSTGCERSIQRCRRSW